MRAHRLQRSDFRLLLACLLALLLFSACAKRTSTRVDWASLEAAGRVVEQPAGMDVMYAKAQFLWGDGSVPVQPIAVAGGIARGVRLTVPISGAQGNETRFMIDTGSTGSLLSSDAPLGREVMLSKVPFQSTGTSARGYLGHLPLVRMGSLQARDLTVSLVMDSVIADVERNILGIQHLFHTQLEHRAGAWTLRSGSARLPVSEAGWTEVRLLPGTPVLEVRGPQGETVKALMDTGAFHSFAIAQGSKGTYVLPGIDGSVAHRFVVNKKENRRIDPRAFAGHEISLVLGNDVLQSRDWRLTFDQSVWAFAPAR